MIKTLPDKWIRKALFDNINNVVVDNKAIPCFDTTISNGTNPSAYVLLGTQSNEVDRVNKCEDKWDSDITVEVVVRYSITGNTGSRVFADDIADKVREVLIGVQLDVSSGLKIITRNQTWLNDLESETDSEMIYRKIVRFEYLII